MSLIPASCPLGSPTEKSTLELSLDPFLAVVFYSLSVVPQFCVLHQKRELEQRALAELCRTMMTFNSMVICHTLCRNCHISNKAQSQWSSNYPEGITKALQVTRQQQCLCGKVSHQPQKEFMSSGHHTDFLRQTDIMSIPSLSPCQCQLYKNRKQEVRSTLLPEAISSCNRYPLRHLQETSIALGMPSHTG